MAEHTIQSAANTLQVLDMLAECGSISAGDVAEQLGLDRSNAYRLLKTMERSGYLEAGRNRYTAGYKLNLFAWQSIDPLQMIFFARPIMREVVEKSGENAHLCMRAPRGVTFVHQEFSDHIIQVVRRSSAVEPAYCTASGRAILAFLSERHQRIILENASIQQYTDNTITDVEELIKEFRKARELGYAEEIGELNQEVRCISVPIFNRRGIPIYSLGVSSTIRDMNQQKVNLCIGYLKAAARKLSQTCMQYEENSGPGF